MKAIIIQDADACNLLDLLKLEGFDTTKHVLARTGDIFGLTDAALKAIVADVHGKFRYIVCRWLQEQGASCVR